MAIAAFQHLIDISMLSQILMDHPNVGGNGPLLQRQFQMLQDFCLGDKTRFDNTLEKGKNEAEACRIMGIAREINRTAAQITGTFVFLTGTTSVAGLETHFGRLYRQWSRSESVSGTGRSSHPTDAIGELRQMLEIFNIPKPIVAEMLPYLVDARLFYPDCPADALVSALSAFGLVPNWPAEIRVRMYEMLLRIPMIAKEPMESEILFRRYSQLRTILPLFNHWRFSPLASMRRIELLIPSEMLSLRQKGNSVFESLVRLDAYFRSVGVSEEQAASFVGAFLDSFRDVAVVGPFLEETFKTDVADNYPQGVSGLVQSKWKGRALHVLPKGVQQEARSHLMTPGSQLIERGLDGFTSLSPACDLFDSYLMVSQGNWVYVSLARRFIEAGENPQFLDRLLQPEV